MTKEDMRAILNIINVKKPTFIRGYSQSLYELANFAKRENIKVCPQNIVISTATTLLKEMRDLVESVFSCKVFDYYGSREVGAIASECFAHDGLHILEDNNILEVVDESGNDIHPGGIGEIIVTTLNNYSMPLIRYRIGDRAATYNKTVKCSCGCNYKKLKQIVGRTADIFILKNGDMVDGTYLTTLLNTIETIERFQIIQHDYNLVELIVQAKEHLPDDKTRMIDTQLKKSMGAECIIKWRYTSFINPGPTGKYRYVISKIKNK
jgi:phenylacetate-CoA ligase